MPGLRRAAALVALGLVATSAAAGRVDDKLTAADPCRNLPQIDETVAVTLERATLTVLPRVARMTLRGRIACRTGQAAMFSGEASVRVEARVALRIADCTATRSTVELGELEGSFAPLVEVFAAPLEQSLAADLAEAAEAECRTHFESD